MRKEKENIENSNKYLQNTYQKLNTDLNETRKSEIVVVVFYFSIQIVVSCKLQENKNLLDREIQKNTDLQLILDNQQASLESGEKKRQCLISKIANLSSISENLIKG